MAKSIEKEIDIINEELAKAKLDYEIQQSHFWATSYPILSHEEKKKIWEKDLWTYARHINSLNDLDFIDRKYIDSLTIREPNILVMYDEVLKDCYWINEQFGEGTIELIRQRIKS